LCSNGPRMHEDGMAWPDRERLDAEQERLAALSPPPWRPATDHLVVGGCFLAFARGEQGPGHTGDRGWAGAALAEEPGHRLLAARALTVRAGAPYEAGRLALREGPALAAAVSALPVAPHCLLVDATGRDHPRRAGLALHLGAVFDVPSVGVTHRPLHATGDTPPDEAGAWTELLLDGEVVGAWLRTRRRARPLAVHAAWRTDTTTAVEVVRRCTARTRTPEPLRQARIAARHARADAETRGTGPRMGVTSGE
jgi:deoxyribonuclease V